MPLVKPQAQPGFQSQATQVQATGAWFAGNLVRWRGGLLEKSKGWQRLTEQPFAAIVRRMHAWLDLDNRNNLLVGSDSGVQLLVQDTQYGLGQQTNLLTGTTTFSVASGSTTVTVNTAAAAVPGSSFLLELPISIGGRILAANTLFTIASASVGTQFTFNMPMAALSTETAVPGVRLFTNDAVNAMTGTWNGHGRNVGDLIKFAQATTLQVGTVGTWEQVNFSAPAGTVVTVASVPTADTFTFAMGALGTGDGVGGSTHQVYEGSVSIAGSVTAGTAIGLATLQPLSDPQKQTWFLDNLGQNGLALATGGPLQEYMPPIENGPWITPVGNIAPISAPQSSNGMFVAMPQAQVILFGTEPILGSGVIDPLLIRWSDVGSYSVWNATVSNQAGSYRLSRGSRIVGAIQAPQATLILTDTDLWIMSYIGPPLIYGFTVMGTGCGLIAPHAIATLGTTTFWQAQKNIWQFGGGGSAQPLACSVWDYIFEDLDTVNINKCHAAPNSSTNEIAFYFPSQSAAAASIEGGNLLKWSQQLNQWVPSGATIQTNVLFAAHYVYEAEYAILGWFDPCGEAPISWYDRDLQGKVSTLILAPDGSGTAYNLQELAVDSMHFISQEILKLGDRITYTLSIYFHDSSTRNLTLRAFTTLGSVYATFNPINATRVAGGATSPALTFISAHIGTDTQGLATGSGLNGWWRCALTFVSDNTPTLDVSFNVTNGTQLNYLGVAGNGCLIWGAQLVEGGEPLNFQTTTGIQIQNECQRYVKYNPVEGQGGAWDNGVLSRSAWIDNSVWGTPLGADANYLVQQHERGYDDDIEPMRDVYAETGFTELSDGSMMMSIDQVQPDFKWFGVGGGVKVRLRAINYAGGSQHLYGPYSTTPTTQYFSTRVRARYVAVRYEWEPLLGFSARVGATTFRVKPAGRKS